MISVMRQLREALAAWSAAGLRLAAATLVRTDGSTPRQLGLALVTTETGHTVGALSGGCVDAELALACDRVLAGGPPEVLTFGDDNSDAAALVCGGAITVWVHPLSLEVVQAILGSTDAVVLTLLLAGQVQQCAITESDATGYECGRVRLDPLQAIAAQWLLRSRQRTELRDAPEGGQMFLEAFGRRRLFIVVGSSGYTEALCAQACLLGYETVVIEPRPRFAAGISYADEVIGSWPDTALEKLARFGRLDSTSAIVVCTHDPKFDEPALVAALRTTAGFIGAMGSRATSADRFLRLRDRGIPLTALQRIQAPVGLDLGGSSPAETAVAVAAQIIAIARGRSAAPLGDTAGPLHAR